MSSSFVVSLIGRPNVGKSSLFNRLMKRSHEAITFDKPGVTRDRHYGIMTLDEFSDRERVDLILVDTGGFYPQKVDIQDPETEKGKFDSFFNIMREHAQVAIAESDLVLLVVDIREGLLPVDKTILDIIRRSKKECWIVINKFDSHAQDGEEGEFYGLGVDYDNLFLTSAAHNLGIPTLRERIQILALDKQQEISQINLQKGVVPEHQVVAKVSILGAPNAGKSTLLNQLLGSARALVSPIAGTTVDPIEGYFDLDFGKDAIHLKNNPILLRSNLSFGEQYVKFLKDVKATQKDEDADEFWDMDADASVADAFEELEEISEEGAPGEEESDELYQRLFVEEGQDENQHLVGAEVGPDLEASSVVMEDDEAPMEELVAEEAIAQEAPVEPESTIRTLQIIDTAGIRRANKVEGFIETQAVFRSLRMIQESDIVLFMVDATRGFTHQDRRLCDIALNKGKSVVIALNKMDLLREQLQTPRARKDWLLDLRAYIPWLDYCEMIQISAKEGKNLRALRHSLKRTTLIRHQEIPTGPLNRLVTKMVQQKTFTLPRSRGTLFKVKYASMVKNGPPTIMLFSNRSQGIPATYRRYLQNAIRREFNLVNTPVHLLIRTSKDLKLKGLLDEPKSKLE